MGTRLWGPDTWYVIHVIAESSPDSLSILEQKHYRQFYESLSNVLPCPSCAVHYKSFLKKDPPVFKTRIEMLQWTIRAHNHANTHTGSPVLSEEDALNRIQQEIQARENGSIRGRLPTLFEQCSDQIVPSIGIVSILLGFLYVFQTRLPS